MTAPKPPVAIRITRPVQTEEEFLTKELDTISRTGVILVGAQQRPEGVLLRFELALASGTPLLRGEGRVVGYKASALGSEPGLMLRFTRLDSKSKAFIDRVVATREIRRSLPPPAPGVPPAIAPPVPEPPPSVEIPVVAEAPRSSKPKTLGFTPERDALLARLRERGARVDADGILAAGAKRRKSV